MGTTFPGESAQYRAARERLLEQEIELRRATEAVAAARRQLPPGGDIPEDYVFSEVDADAAAGDVRLSELFAPGRNSLLIYNFMFPRGYRGERPGPASGRTALLSVEEGPCPSCVALLDQLDGATAASRRKLVFPGNHAPLTHLPPSSVATIGKTDQADQYDLSRFWAAVDASNMPAVSFLKAPGYQDGHAGYSDRPGCASARD